MERKLRIKNLLKAKIPKNSHFSEAISLGKASNKPSSLAFVMSEIKIRANRAISKQLN